jgi:DNA polymerase III gamma/tau subunit
MEQHKKEFVRLIAAIADHNSRDKESAAEYLNAEGISTDSLKKDIDFIAWLSALRNVAIDMTGSNDFKINATEARKFYDDGFTPYQTFRETRDIENDA